MAATPTGCVHYDPDLSALIDGELGAAREAELRRHCSECARCESRAAALQGAGEALRQAPLPQLPWDLESRLRARIEEDRAARRRVVLGVAPPPPRRPLWRLGVAAGCALAATLALLLWLGPRCDAAGVASGARRVARDAPAPRLRPALAAPGRARVGGFPLRRERFVPPHSDAER
ncbi:MAG: hypothetical protein JSU66_09910 [Deltaproteobacteria bacterium]|nr:MAG: hypothetical protein JSU66_09910 [Deltaproteobacteria bacterium]